MTEHAVLALAVYLAACVLIVRALRFVKARFLRGRL